MASDHALFSIHLEQPFTPSDHRSFVIDFLSPENDKERRKVLSSHTFHVSDDFSQH